MIISQNVSQNFPIVTSDCTCQHSVKKRKRNLGLRKNKIKRIARKEKENSNEKTNEMRQPFLTAFGRPDYNPRVKIMETLPASRSRIKAWNFLQQGKHILIFFSIYLSVLLMTRKVLKHYLFRRHF